MAKFLNTEQLNEWIPKLINEAVGELFIIVPYIKTSTRVYKYLKDANDRGVEITIIYRENELKQYEKDKLYKLENLNLLHHPNVHAKCYYDQYFMIIASMNLTEYSQKNNREMGVLLDRIDSMIGKNESSEVFEDAVLEINKIINSSTIEKKSIQTSTNGFGMEIIKTEHDKILDFCKDLNRVFVNKKFAPRKVGNTYFSFCEEYYDKMDLIISHRAELYIKKDKNELEQIFKRYTPFYHEYKFDGFKFYWNYANSPVYVYADFKRDLFVSEEVYLELLKEAVNSIILDIKQYF